MTVRRWSVAALGCLASVAFVPTAGDAAAPRSSAPDLWLVDQDFVLPGGPGALRITLAGDALGPASCAGGLVRVIAYRPVTTRDDATEALEDPGASVDDIEFDLSALTRTAAGGVAVTVPTSVGPPAEATVATLRLASPGVIPLSVEVQRSGAPTAELLTFVDRLADGTDATTPVDERMQVAAAVVADGGPTLQPDGSTVVSPGDQAEVQRLLDLLQDIPEQAPITVAVRPELVEGLARSSAAGDHQLLATLAAEVQGTEVLSLPYVAIDPTSAERAGLADWFRTQMTRGEDVVRERLGVLPQRNIWLIGSPLGTDGAQLLRDLGVGFGVVLPSHGYVAFAPPDRQFLIDVGDSTLPAAQLDKDMGAALAEPGDDPTLTAYRLAAQVLLTRSEALRGSAPIADHNVILSTTDGRVGDPTVMAKLLQVLSGVPELSMVTTSTIGNAAKPMQVNGQTTRGTLPDDPDTADLTDLAKALFTTTGDIDATSSMLPTGDARPLAWRALTQVASSAGLDGERRAAYFAAVTTDTEAIRGSIVPPAKSSFTLGGRRSTIRLSLRNTGDTDLTVRVRISSSKLDIAPEDEDRLVLVPAGATEPIEVPVEARTNGEFPVDVDILTPEPETGMPVTERVVLTARVNALTGLGQLATGGFVLVLLTWWVHHIRQRRRRAAIAAAATAA